MPALFLLVTDKSVCGMFHSDSEDVSFHMFPYKYSKVLSGYSSEESFYKSVVSIFCKEADAKISDITIFFGGDVSKDLLGSKATYVGDTYTILTGISNFNTFLVNDYSFYFGNKLYANKAHASAKNISSIDIEDFNNNSNLIIYPQLLYTDIGTQVALDRSLLTMQMQDTLEIVKEIPVVFMGQRFRQNFVEPEANYLLMLSLLRALGIYDVFVDEHFSLMLFQMAMIVGYKDLNIDNVKLKKVFTLVSSSNSLECLIKSNVGTAQLVELSPDKIFTVPVLHHEFVSVSVKSTDLGIVEKVITGGELGILFDTRPTKHNLLTNVKLFNEGLKVFSNALATI